MESFRSHGGIFSSIMLGKSGIVEGSAAQEAL